MPASVANIPSASRSGSRARKAAETQAASTVSGSAAADKLMPEGVATSDAAPAAEGPVIRPLFVLSVKNPKRGSIAPKHFEHYYNPSKDEGAHRQITTLNDAYDRGVRGKDVSWDMDRMHILVGDDAVNYQALENDDQRRAFLEQLLDAKLKAKPAIGTKDKMLPYVLKQAGLWIEPAKPEEPAAKPEAATA